MAAKLAEEQLIGGCARWGGDVNSDLSAVADPVMDVVAQVSSQIAAVWQDIQRDAREWKKGSDFLQEKNAGKSRVLVGKNRNDTHKHKHLNIKRIVGKHVCGALAKDKLKEQKTRPIPRMLLPLTHAEPWDTVQ